MLYTGICEKVLTLFLSLSVYSAHVRSISHIQSLNTTLCKEYVAEGGGGVMDWIQLAQDTEKCLCVVNTAVSFPIL